MVDTKTQSPSRVSTRASAAAAAAAATTAAGSGGGNDKPAAKKAKVTSSKPTSPSQNKRKVVEVDLSSDIAASAGAIVATAASEKKVAAASAAPAASVPSVPGASTLNKKDLALKIALENGVDRNSFSQYDICMFTTGMKISNEVLHDTSNPGRVFSVVDASCKRFAVDACYDMVHALATAFALEAHAGGSPDWGSVAVVVHDSMADALKAVHDSGANTFVPCVGKDEAIVKTSPVPSTPKASGVAGAAKTGEGKASSPSAHSGSAAAAGRGGGTMRSPSVSPSKHLNLDEMDLKVDKKTLQKFKSAKSAGGPVKWKLSFCLSDIVKTSGRAKVVGTFTLTDRHGNPYYAFKSDSVIYTLQALVEVPALAALTDFAKSLEEVTMRDIPSGADVGKVSYSKKTGSAFPVNTTMFSLDLSEKIRPPKEELVSLVQMVHEVVGSKVFKDTYIDICVNGGRWENLFGTNGAPPETHSIWQILKNCDLDVVDPSPLDTTLMDKEVLAAMAYLTSGVPPHEWAADPFLSKVAYNEGQVPAGVFKQDN